MKILAAAALGLLFLPSLAFADTMVVDRGLPTSNLNDAAGSNRSNVGWGFPPTDFVGDNFTLPGVASTNYTINTIRTWAISSAADVAAFTTAYSGGINLFTGTGTTLGFTAANPTVTQVTYAGGANYQPANHPDFKNIYEIDFTGLNINANGGSTISFGVEGVGSDIWFNHASNGPLSGSPQDGSDGSMLTFTWDGNTAHAPVFDGLYNSAPVALGGDGGWDKSSDINVQVFADVPEPASMSLLAAGALGLGFVQLRRRR